MESRARRSWLKQMLALSAAQPLTALPVFASNEASPYPAVQPRPLVFPRDFGAHPEFRTEWWYLTGWLDSGTQAIGFQVTFFRSRTRHPGDNPSRFAPQQLMFAHAALALPDEGKLRHAELAGRVGPAGVSFETTDTALKISDWTLNRTSDDRYQIYVPATDFTLSMQATPAGDPVLRGQAGYSLKGPSPELASYYYSRPQLDVSAQLTLKDNPSRSRSPTQEMALTGKAWFDHEWSSSLLMTGAVGWDWIGINLLDGGSLMAFRIRDDSGQTLFSEWDWRDAQGNPVDSQSPMTWEPFGSWRSPRSLVVYPEGFTLNSPNRQWQLKPLMADQEIDARASTGGFYYEGAVELLDGDQVIGRGYLELTGYGEPLRL